jgi:hypothetical protein
VLEFVAAAAVIEGLIWLCLRFVELVLFEIRPRLKLVTGGYCISFYYLKLSIEVMELRFLVGVCLGVLLAEGCLELAADDLWELLCEL